MKGLTIEKIEKVTGGILHLSLLTRAGIFADYDRETLRSQSPRAVWIFDRGLKLEVTGIVTDSRKAGPGSLFGAIVGERTDGHRYAGQVYDRGAFCVLAERHLGKEELFTDEAVARGRSAWTGPTPMTDWRGDPKAEKRRKIEMQALAGGLAGDSGRTGEETAAGGSSLTGGASAAGGSGLSGTEGTRDDGSFMNGTAPDGTLFRLWIEVDDTQEALRRIAEEYLKILQIPVVGITGSVGKTSTKEMIASVLQTHVRTLKTEGNFNNGLGLPLTVFRLTEKDKIAVLEMGVSHFGDMDQLARVARPDTMVITNIGTCHLEFLGDRDGIMRAKTEVFRYMKEDGHVILNGNGDRLRTIREVNGRAPLWFGVSSDTEGAEDLSVGEKQEYPGKLDPSRLVVAKNIRRLGFEGSLCTMVTPEESFEVRVPVPGIHNVSNAAAATAVGLTYGLSPEEIIRGIESMETISGRFRILKAEGRTIIDDCYNANPVSMKSSLSVLSEAPGASGRRVAVLGDMGELGKDEVLMHGQVGEYAAGCCDRLIAIGELSKHLLEAAEKKNRDLSAVWYPDVDSFLAHREEEIKEGDTVLVKASHFMGFSKIVEALTEDKGTRKS